MNLKTKIRLQLQIINRTGNKIKNPKCHKNLKHFTFVEVIKKN